MSDTSLAHATVTNLDQGNTIKCMFNPKEYTWTKTNNWDEGKVPAKNISDLHFTGGKSATLKMDLFFDTYAEGKDVRKEYTDAFWELMSIDPSKKDKNNDYGRPPRVLFQWGAAWSFEAVITSLSQQFTLFLSDGTPVRATLTVNFQQVRDTANLAPQNPTSGGAGGERVWQVGAGDTLAWIAYREYGDATKWRLIAQANNLIQVRELAPGTVLVIPNE
ncbi:MAG: LysM peptidoglycan-binding domain-containing protein [Kouleothrix sp.]|nr:LysM peptidoglycan-binding domain-containing protein [Kouleothrix sp.]